MSFVQMSNEIIQLVTIDRHFKFDDVIKYNRDDCYLTILELTFIIISEWRTNRWKRKTFIDLAKLLIIRFIINNKNNIDTKVANNMIETITSCYHNNSHVIEALSSSTNSIEIRSSLMLFSIKYVIHNDIFVYENLFAIMKLAMIANVYLKIWDVELEIVVNIFENEWMSIHLRSNVKFKLSKVYSLDERDRTKVDKTFDKLHKKSKMT